MKLPLQVKVNGGADKVMIYTADGEQLCTVHSGLSIPELRGMKKEEITKLRIVNADCIVLAVQFVADKNQSALTEWKGSRPPLEQL